MVRSWDREPSFAVWIWSVALCACFACGDDTTEPSAPFTRDAGNQPRDAGNQPRDAGHVAHDASSQPRTLVPASQRFATASAALSAVADADADGGFVLRGSAKFAATVEGVDLQIELQGCAGEDVYPLAILQASDCSPESLRGPVWSEGRGKGLPVLHCAGTGAGLGGASYERPAMRPNEWTIGDRADSDVVGHVLVVRDGAGAIVACGAITAGPDVERRALPPDDQPPKLESRAAVGGLCLARQLAGSSANCPDSNALVSCEALHCDVAGCLDTCASYTSCLEGQSDVCAFVNGCQPSAECVACQGELQECGMYFCGEHMFCAAAPTPDGPCQRMAGCCALQGRESGICMGLLLPFLAGLGGDANCLGSMQDWDVVAHIHVPCTFGPGEPSSAFEPAPPTSPTPQLADGRVGAECTSDAECQGGLCATAAANGVGYCTRVCEAASECGRGGMCSGGQAVSGKLCLATCNEHADCRDGFVCTGRLEGARLTVPGVCSPKRRADQLADNVAGRECQDDSACSGGKCAKTNLLGTAYPGNYCSARCYEDAQCGKGGVCLWTHHNSDPGYCLQHCDSDADCTREDYGCWELGDGTRSLRACYPLARPLADGRAGQPCSVDADCGGTHAFCAKELPYEGLVVNDLLPAPGGYCTQRCALDRECGGGAQCINYGSSGGVCLASCSGEVPCRDGYACFGHSRDNDETASVCVTPGP